MVRLAFVRKFVSPRAVSSCLKCSGAKSFVFNTQKVYFLNGRQRDSLIIFFQTVYTKFKLIGWLRQSVYTRLFHVGHNCPSYVIQKPKCDVKLSKTKRISNSF